MTAEMFALLTVIGVFAVGFIVAGITTSRKDRYDKKHHGGENFLWPWDN